jgi:hypothetical protein
MGAPAIFEKQIEIKLLHPASTLESRIQEFNKPFESLWFNHFNGDFPECFKNIQGVTLLYIENSETVDLSALSNNSLVVLSFESVNTITGTLEADNPGSIGISDSNLSPSAKSIPQTSTLADPPRLVMA